MILQNFLSFKPITKSIRNSSKFCDLKQINTTKTYKMLFLLLLSLYFSPILSHPENCTLFPQTLSKFDKTIVQAEILCRNVSSNFIIRSFHFVKQSYPQDVIITESMIPTLSNYSTLLNMRHVRKLYLKGQGIKRIVPGAFRNMQSLEELDLSYNHLNEIPDGAFTGLQNLTRLNLNGNNITVNPQNALGDLPNLENLDFSENPVVIDDGALSEKVQIKT